MDHPEEVSALILNAELVVQLEREIQALPPKIKCMTLPPGQRHVYPSCLLDYELDVVY